MTGVRNLFIILGGEERKITHERPGRVDVLSKSKGKNGFFHTPISRTILLDGHNLSMV